MMRIIFLLFIVFLFAQCAVGQVVITGKVADGATNQPLPGTTVSEVGTLNKTTADGNGIYNITVLSDTSKLMFSHVGYETKEIDLQGRKDVDVRLNSENSTLGEVVVVGYGTQRKTDLTSAISEVSGKDLTERPVNSIQQALQGKVTGLTVLDKGGAPGAPNTNIVIRGVGSPYTPVGLSTAQVSSVGDNGPLVIVDGIEQPFQNINPQDIESVSILKDASSTAIYGSRAGNGVILITTKRADNEKLAVSYNAFYALQKSVSNPKPMDIKDYLVLENIAYKNVGSAPPYPYRDEDIELYARGAVTDPLKFPLPYNWYDIMFHTAPQINQSLSLSGGGKNFKARTTVRNQFTKGIIDNVESRLSEIRINTNYTVSSKINIETDMNYRYQDDSRPYDLTEIFRLMMQNAIWNVPKYPNGDYGGGAQGNSPLILTEKGGSTRITSDYIIANIKGNWEITRGLNFSIQFAGQATDWFNKSFQNTWQTRDSTIIKKQNLHNTLTEYRNYDRNFTLNELLNYSATIGNHGLKALLGYSQIYDRASNLSAYRQDFYNNDVQSMNAGADDDTKDNSGLDWEWGLRSYFGRFNYIFNNKYLFEANARYDGSSRFTGSKRYSFFPSFSAGWRISQEDFWSNLKNSINELKLRGSWGKSGNQAVALYSYFPTLNLVSYNFSGSPVQGYVQQSEANPNLTWETVAQTDIGLDGELLKGKYSFTVDYYKKRTSGILLTLPVPGTLGLSPGPQNAGIVENKGWEFILGTRQRFGDFGLMANLNFSINENRVVDLAGTGPYINGTDIDPRYITAVGYPINSFWGYKTDGLFQTDDEAMGYPQFMRPAKAGDVKVLDLDHNGTINPDDMTYLGNSFPKYNFGSIINLTYKGFSLNIALQGAAKVGMRYARALAEAGNYEGFTPDVYTDNYWTPEHTDAYYARPVKRDLRNQASTDRMVLNASYLRLKNLQIMYRVPGSVTKNIFINNLSVYVSGTNLFTISELNKFHMDPESSSGWQNYYPQISLYTFGINVDF